MIESVLLPTRSTTRSIKRLIPFLKERNLKTVLDYGSGTLRNTNYFLRNGFKVNIVDKKEQLAKISELPEIKYIDRIFSVDDQKILDINVDIVISNFVLDLLTITEQNRMLYYIQNILNHNGYFLIEIKKSNVNDKNSIKFKQQSYLDNLIIPLGFNRVCSYRNRYSISNLYQKINYCE